MSVRAATALVALIAAGPARAEASACFDLRRPIARPRVGTGDEPGAASGAYADGRVWARLRATVDQPIARVLALLLDPRRWPDPEVDALEVERLAPGPHAAALRVRSRVDPFPLVHVAWTNEWVFDVTEGTLEAPRRVVASYQKVEGTGHIAHYCGSVVLRRVDDATTDVYQYEESDITGRDEDDQAAGLAWLLQQLRAKA